MTKTGKKNSKNTINYFKTHYLPTGYDENKLIYEVNRSYEKNAEMFGMQRGEYKPYSEYKKQNPIPTKRKRPTLSNE